MREPLHAIRTSLSHAGLDEAETDELGRELADHLDDVRADALRRGASPQEAESCVTAAAADWNELGRDIRRARRGGVPMSADFRTIAIPGLTATGVAAAGLFLLFWLLGAEGWTDARPVVHVVVALLAAGVFGGVAALGAGWSRRAGGRPFDRAVAGLLPSFAMLVVAAAGLVVDGMRDLRTHPGQQPFSLQVVKIGLIMLMPIGASLAGALPFVRARR